MTLTHTGGGTGQLRATTEGAMKSVVEEPSPANVETYLSFSKFLISVCQNFQNWHLRPTTLNMAMQLRLLGFRKV